MKERTSWRLALLFTVYIFLIITITMFVSIAIMLFLYHCGILSGNPHGVPFLILACISVVLGTFLSRVASSKIFRKLDEFVDATQQVAKGNFQVRLDDDYSTIKEMKIVSQNFNRMVQELSQTEILRNDFVENVSHEFKTPLAAIEGYATLLQKKDLPEDKKEEYTDKILSSTQRLSALSGNILLLSRIENRELDIRRDAFSLDEQIREALLFTEQSWSAKNIELDLDLEECEFNGSQDLLGHVWRNLIDNAIRFSPDGGTISIRLHKDENAVRVTVTDQGPGIAPEDQARIFEKFYQADRSRSAQGNGLGLALVRRITDLHHGTVELQSEPGHGASFTVTLPIEANAV